ncbi:hypothetical protein PIB30_057837 [Stylosanthes scabra]|uniref:Uncharacterized protein n=1 Tax=Stylosanthes scabra TaxID=79078 RepID=A0ABU6UII8_9FABA|nr:hypothetical protein [Stylosanthes scabra]
MAPLCILYIKKLFLFFRGEFSGNDYRVFTLILKVGISESGQLDRKTEPSTGSSKPKDRRCIRTGMTRIGPDVPHIQQISLTVCLTLTTTTLYLTSGHSTVNSSLLSRQIHRNSVRFVPPRFCLSRPVPSHLPDIVLGFSSLSLRFCL